MKQTRVPNQKKIITHKKICDKNNIYTTNNLDALGQAASRLDSKGGFKLYMYLAKNQDEYHLNLSSRDFTQWASLSRTAYKTAFDELVAEGYLVQDEEDKDCYLFYDESQLDEEDLIIYDDSKL